MHLIVSNQKINFIIVYRFGKFTPAVFLTEFYNFIESIFIHVKNFIILGDFNLHVNDVLNPDTIRFNNILSSFGLSQLVDQPTHILGNTLDLVITNQGEVKIKDIIVDQVNYSDHSFIFFKACIEIFAFGTILA